MSHLPLAGTEFAVPVLASLWWFRTDTFLDVGELGASVLPASRFFFSFFFFFPGEAESRSIKSRNSNYLD